MRSAGGWGTSGSTVLCSAHALGVPVRAAGIVPVLGPGKRSKLVEALDADPLIAAALDAATSRACRLAARSGSGAPTWCR